MTQFLKTRDETQAWLDEMGIIGYTIKKNLTVDVDECVNLEGKGLTHFPVRFGAVFGDFDCSGNQLTSLEGAPKKVAFGTMIGGCFNCSGNQLTSLEGAPISVQVFYCSYNLLTSLNGCPKSVQGFSCSYNLLTSLEGAPRFVRYGFDCSNNQLTSLEGSPEEVGGHFFCSDNQLASLKGAPSRLWEDFRCSDNQLTSLEGAPERVDGFFYCSGNPLRDVGMWRTRSRIIGPSVQEVEENKAIYEQRKMLRATADKATTQKPPVARQKGPF